MNNAHDTGDTRRVVVGLSGGVDSAVATALLKQEGFDVHAVSFQLWQAPFVETNDATAGARDVAAALEVPFEVVDLREQFRQEVVAGFVDDYAKGITPNPCIHCNPRLKFAALIEVADRLHAWWIATGHYARLECRADDPVRLLKARSLRRDQSYVLYRLTQAQLARLKLPLGEVRDKESIRALASDLQLPGAQQRDSQDLCFLNGGDYRVLLEHLRPDSLRPGPIRDTGGKELGQHQGLPRYTIGQRSGLGIATGERLYVIDLWTEDNTLIVGPAEALLCTECLVSDLTFIAGTPPAAAFTAEAKIRYRAPLTPVHVSLDSAHSAGVRFSIPQRGITPGQSLVLYHGDAVLGGGVIMPSRELLNTENAL
ncbi:MAG: tRNA 2-thiouridine(34) synthase MnmA [Anaerolineae bacterium]|nr:tRNA 2-thiouridine(34) synthase MnmA [Anaerolineae bacterium]